MNSTRWMNKARMSWAAVGVLIVIAIITALVSSSGSSKAVSDNTNTDGTTPPKADAAVINALTVKTVNTDCATSAKTVKNGSQELVVYDVGAIKSTPPRKWSDALSTPLGGTSPPEMLTAQQAAVCEDPELGVSTANMFANLNVGGVNVGDLNPWLAPYKGDAGQINDKAAGFIPLLDVAHPSDAQVQEAAKQNIEYQALAARLDTLIGRFSNKGVNNSPKSSENWHLTAGGLAVGGLPEVGLNPNQESLPALMLEVTEKGACAPLKIIGFNTGDKRPEVFPTPTCQSPHKPGKSSTPMTSAPPKGCTSNCGSVPPTCTSNCHPTTSHPTPSTTPPTTPPTTHHSTPPVTCASVYGPGYSGNYPNCHKDPTSVTPTAPSSAPGTNPAPDPSHDPGSNKCYSETTGLPVAPLPDGTCPPGSFGG